MTVQTAAGATLGVTSAAPASADAYGYSQLAFTLIGELTDVGEIGRAYNLVTHNAVGTRSTGKRKGSFNDGSSQLAMGLDDRDAGQAILRMGARSDDDYSFCLTLQSGDRVFFPAQVMTTRRSPGSVDKIVQRMSTLELTSIGGIGLVELLAGVVPVAPPQGLAADGRDPANAPAFIH